ncbi:hypothetical protein FUAX_55550 (plasmid) [Fulvitalea axinellae]|uniref:ATPase AAA-type core domain-containing protein n=1 Tax=Fulvitalea axinellae TaxID=1182444 RepID=A0AAU9CSP7_9BACT|nr:hypothetical protein FUAX_55550 [Fulvitalea axinellae]
MMDKETPKYSLKQFEIRGFQGIRETGEKDLPAGAPWIFVTGENGFGKTSLLRGLAIGLNGLWDKRDDDRYLGEKEKGSSVDLQVSVKNMTKTGYTARWVSQKGERKNVQVPFVAYGPVRIPSGKKLSAGYESHIKSLFSADGDLLYPFEDDLKDLFKNEEIDQLKAEKSLDKEYNNILLDLFFEDKSLSSLRESSNVKLSDFSHSFLNYFEKQKSKNKLSELTEKLELFHKEAKNKIKHTTRYNLVRDFLIDLMDNIDRIEVGDHDIFYFEKEDPKTPKRIHQLASGNRMLLSWVGDLLHRLGGDSIKDPSDVEGIVIIDELDLHLHPKWQKDLPDILSRHLPKVQFIASTHSPIPLLGAPEGSVFLKVNRTESEGITVKRLDFIESQIKNMLPNVLLGSEVFDLDNLVANTNDDFSEVMTGDSYKEAKERAALRDKVKVIKTSNPDFFEALKRKRDHEKGQ